MKSVVKNGSIKHNVHNFVWFFIIIISTVNVTAISLILKYYNYNYKRNTETHNCNSEDQRNKTLNPFVDFLSNVKSPFIISMNGMRGVSN